MPVDGYGHKHLWLYRSKARYPWPQQPVLDPDWDELDRDWEWDLVDRLQRGAAAPSNIATRDLVRSWSSGDGAGSGWEAAEEHAKDAIRTGAAFLNDQSIARRLPERERRKRAYAELKARWEAEKPQREAEKAERIRVLTEEAAERREAERVWREKQAERERARAEREAEWSREAELIEAARAKAAALAAEERRKLLEELAGAGRRREEEERILSNRWQCKQCLKVAEVAAQGAGYVLRCRACGTEAWGARAALLKMTAAG